MRLYWELAARAFQRTAAYRAAAFSGALTNIFFGLLRAYVFVAFFQSRASVGGYDLRDSLTFTFLSQGLAPLAELFSWWRIAESVTSGQIVTDLSRPYDFEGYWLAQDYGRAAFQLLFRTAPMLVVGLFFFPLRLPPDALHWLALLPCLTLAVTVSFAYRFCVNLTSFWLLDYRGAVGVGNMVVLFFSGFLVPVTMFPNAVRTALYLLPFASIVSVPVDIYLGKVAGWSLAGALALQLFWCAAGLLLARGILTLAMRKLVVQGG